MSRWLPSQSWNADRCPSGANARSAQSEDADCKEVAFPERSIHSIGLVWCRPDSGGVYVQRAAFDTANNPAPSVVSVEMLSIAGMGELVTSRCARSKPSAKSVPLCRKSRCPLARTCRSRRPAAAPCALRSATAARRCFLCRSRSRPAGSGWCRATPCPGSTCGNRWVNSPVSSVVVTTGVPPPSEDTRDRPVCLSGEKKMVPSLPQSAPRPFGASHSVIAPPPETEIFFSFPDAKNASHWPSGKKTGSRRRRSRAGVQRPAGVRDVERRAGGSLRWACAR